MNKTNISWTGFYDKDGRWISGYTLNPLYKIISLELNSKAHGCNKKSPACANCYSELMNIQQRFLGDGKPYKGITYADMMLDYKALSELQTNTKKPKGVFLCSMTDWAAVSEFVRMEWAIDILQACATSKYTCYLLTKRAENLPEILRQWQIKHRVASWPSNVWLGFTAENQEWFDKRWASFTDADGVLDRFYDVNIFVSYEPALGSLVLPHDFLSGVRQHQRTSEGGPFSYYKWSNKKRWLIAGGESGNNARPPHPWDFVQIKNQCLENGVGFHFKGWATWRPIRGADAYKYKHPIFLPCNWGMKKAPRAEGNDLLFGESYKWTPLNTE